MFKGRKLIQRHNGRSKWQRQRRQKTRYDPPPPVSSVLMKAEDTATPQGDCGLMFQRFTKNKPNSKPNSKPNMFEYQAAFSKDVWLQVLQVLQQNRASQAVWWCVCVCVCVFCDKRSLSSFVLLHDTSIQLHTHAASHGIFEKSIMLFEFSDTGSKRFQP